MFKNYFKIRFNRGVTMVELLVVIFIFMIITGITIFNYGKFNSTQSVQNLADDIALSIRKAQGYAIGVHSSGSVFTVGYGIHFTKYTTVLGTYSGSNKSFILFSDIGNGSTSTQDKMYNYGSTCGSPTISSECLEALSINGADSIVGINYIIGSTSYPLGPTGVIDIVFKRPNPEPSFCYRTSQGGSSCDASSTISSVEIIISNNLSPSVQKTIKIANSGQISVSN